MTKKILLEITGVILLSILFVCSYIFMYKKEKEIVCETDVLICANGAEVKRVAPICEFATCPDVVPVVTQEVPQPPVDPTSFEPAAQSTTTNLEKNKKIAAPEPSSSFLEKVVTTVVSLFSDTTTPSYPSTNQTQAQPVVSTTQPPEPSTSKTYNDNRYTVTNNTLVDTEGNTVTSLPSSNYTPPTTSGSDWQTHTVNAIDVGSTTPVIDGVPVIGSEGKYYVSENSFGNIGLCEFSNRIYLLDTLANTKELLYEENSSTLSKDDPRACNSEIFLLATEENKLILKYHTINTNMICESTWSAPDKTWFLDVTSFASGMTRYQITQERYEDAEQKEITCRESLPSTQTE